MVPTVRWDDESVVMIDQRRLPGEEVFLRCRTVPEVAAAIRDMAIRGAPAIGVAAAYGLALAVRASAAEDRALADEFAGVTKWPARVAVTIGARETAPDPQDPRNLAHVKATRELEQLLAGQISADALRVQVDPEGAHNENAWARRLPTALQFLFPPPGR